MVHWVYVLECEDDYIYVGETTRLYRRFNEHLQNRGGINTFTHKPQRLIGLYKVNENHSFIKYRNRVKNGEYNKFILEDWENDGDNLLIENHITHRFFYERRKNKEYGDGLGWYKVRGGKYTKDIMDDYDKWVSQRNGTINLINPISAIPKDSIIDRPLCKCKYPSEVKLSKDKTKIYFVCSLKNVWEDFFSGLERTTPCDFWQMYTEDTEVKFQYQVVKARTNESWLLNIPLSKYKVNPESCISCKKSEYCPIFYNGVRRVCQSCIFYKYDELKEKYSFHLL